MATFKAGDLIFAIGIDNTGLQKGIQQVQNDLKGFATSMLGIGSIGALAMAFHKTAMMAEEENEALRRLKFALDSTGIGFDKNNESISAWAKTIQATTRYEDGEAYETLGKFIRATGDLNEAMILSQTAMGMASASGKTLEETQGLLISTLRSNPQVIRQLNADFKEYIKGAKTGDEVLKQLIDRFVNQAEAEKSWSKELAVTRNKIQDIQETIGNQFLPILASLSEAALFVLKGFQTAGEGIALFATESFTALKGLSSAIGDAIKLDFKNANQSIKQTQDEMANQVQLSADKINEIWSQSKVSRLKTSKDAGEQEKFINTEAEESFEYMLDTQSLNLGEFNKFFGVKSEEREHWLFEEKEYYEDLNLAQGLQDSFRKFLDDFSAPNLLQNVVNNFKTNLFDKLAENFRKKMIDPLINFLGADGVLALGIISVVGSIISELTGAKNKTTEVVDETKRWNDAVRNVQGSMLDILEGGGEHYFLTATDIEGTFRYINEQISLLKGQQKILNEYAAVAAEKAEDMSISEKERVEYMKLEDDYLRKAANLEQDIAGWQTKYTWFAEKFAPNTGTTIYGHPNAEKFAPNTGTTIYGHPNLASYQTGTTFVPRNMLASIHKGEAVIPAEMNPWNSDSGTNLGGNIYFSPTFTGIMIGNETDWARLTRDNILPEIKRAMANSRG